MSLLYTADFDMFSHRSCSSRHVLQPIQTGKNNKVNHAPMVHMSNLLELSGIVLFDSAALKVPKRGKFHAAIRVTSKRCDSCAQGALGRRMVSRRNLQC